MLVVFEGKVRPYPLSLAENIPRDCKTLIMKTEEACRELENAWGKTNAVLHLTC